MEKSARKIAITREQVELTNLISELENSVALVKEQINSLTVESLHLKYLLITTTKRDPDSANTSKPAQPPKLNLALKKEPQRYDLEEEDDDDNELGYAAVV